MASEISPEKPWIIQRREEYSVEFHQLGLVQSFLEHQLIGVKDRRTELRRLIVETYTDKIANSANQLGLGLDGMPKSKFRGRDRFVGNQVSNMISEGSPIN